MTRSSSPDLAATLLALLSLLVLAFAFQGSRGIYSPDEGYYVGVSDAMVRTGDYLTPRLGGTVWLDKPPLSFWGVASGLRLLGHNEWGARAFHALCYVLTTLLVHALGRSLYGPSCGKWAGVIYATMIMPFLAANIVTPDTPLTLATTAAYYCFWRGFRTHGWRAGVWNIIMSTAFGLAFLTKGPATLVPAAAIFSFLLLRGQVLSYFLRIWTPVGLLIFCLVGLGWYVYTAKEFPSALEYFWKSEVVGRTISAELARNSGPRGALIYLPVLLVGTLPWSAAWWPALWRRRRRIVRLSQWRWFPDDPAHLLLATWIAVPILILLLARSRLPLYALPVFPALALATSRSTCGWPGRQTGPGNPSGFSATGIGFLILWCAALLGMKLMAAHYTSERDMRALYASMEEHLPRQGTYDIVAVSDHLEGLGFYSPQLVERVTVTRTPYPFFIAPENLEQEVVEMATSHAGHVFVGRGRKVARRVRGALDGAGARFEEASLPLDYHMFVCQPSDSDGVFRLAVVGDSGESSARNRRLTVASATYLIAAERSLEGVLILGDTTSREVADEEARADLARRMVEDPFAELLKEGVPFHVLLGEHPDEPALPAFQFNRGPIGMTGGQSHSEVLGGGLIELFGLDSGALVRAVNTGDAEALAWLDRSLAASRAPWKIVVLHHPVHSVVEPAQMQPDQAVLLQPILVRRGVALVLQGGVPHYERSTGTKGIVYVSPGSAGAVIPRGEHLDVPEGAFHYDRMQVFLVLECDRRAGRLVAYNGLGQVVDEATVRRPARGVRQSFSPVTPATGRRSSATSR